MRRVMQTLVMIFTLLGTALPAIAGEAPATIAVSSAWIRATPPVAKVGAAYLTIASEIPDRLLGASTTAAERVEIHATVDNNGVLQMRQQPDVAIVPGKPMVLAPGGAHLMLINLQTTLTADTTISIVLKFERAGEVTVAVPVLKDAPASSHQGHH